MKQIRLAKYGFIRSEKDDFNDDGNYFQCYRVGNVRVSKLVADGEAYISGNSHPNGAADLPYDVYSKLPHYKELDALNGIPVSWVTENDLTTLYNACIEYEKEYKEAVDSYDWPSKETIKEKVIENNTYRKREYEALTANLTVDKMLTLSDYDFRKLKEYLMNIKKQIINPDTFADSCYGTAYSVNYVNQDYSKEDFWVKYAKEIIEKIA